MLVGLRTSARGISQGEQNSRWRLSLHTL